MIARIPMVVLLGLACLLPQPAGALPDEPAGAASEGNTPAVPSAFEPFVPLVGRWQGQAVPADNPLRGWRESHEWSYAFRDGEPVGLTLTIEDGKVLASARLSFDPDAKLYRLDGTDPDGQPIVFVGSRDEKTNALTLERSGPEGEDRLTIRPNSNGIRSDFWFDRKQPGSPQFARLIRANLGKEGVNFAAGGAATSGPQCIVTGGAATITVSAGGSSFAVCCSGCRDEVLADPEKYARKLRASLTSSPASGPDSSQAGAGASEAPRPSDRAETPPKPSADEPSPAPEPAPSDGEARRKAASLFRLGQSLERQGKPEGALTFYRRIVDETPETPEAQAALERIKALAGDD